MGARKLRLLVAAFGDSGHALPAIALARGLRDRGHRVVVETWERWREAVVDAGLEFVAAQEYRPFAGVAAPPEDVPSIADAARALVPLLDDLAPDLAVSDILTGAPALAAELRGVRRATLIPHVYPVGDDGLPFYGFGAMPPRTAVGRGLWRAARPLLDVGLRQGLRDLNRTRVELGLATASGLHAGISRELALVATLPQLEYPRRWPAHVQVTGPMVFETPYPDIELPPGDRPLVVVAPSTAKDRGARLVRASLEALADEPVRVLATTNRAVPAAEVEAPANARVVDWVSYSQVMPEAALVICHGGHGTVVRALAAGAPVLSCGSAGDMAENGARVAWAGAGLAIPRRLVGPGPVRWATRRILGEPRFAKRAADMAAWAREHDGRVRGAELVERLLAARRGRARGPLELPGWDSNPHETR
jgi:UDP:flavonoid glycosyltransferase YjiC (YdhE family)